jgi:hypothetical protein
VKTNFNLLSKTKVLIFICFVTIINNSCGNENVHFSCGFSEASQIGINHLQPFVDAMEKYKIDVGKYPQNGLELIPKYLSKVPTIAIKGMILDDIRVDVLKTDKIDSYKTSFADDGRSFSIEFFPKDDRTCLLGGRNNVCEYRSETKQWGCYQH